jgi:hypothetical protein
MLLREADAGPREFTGMARVEEVFCTRRRRERASGIVVAEG